MSEQTNGKILYLDDDSFFAKIYKDKFTAKGYSVQTCGSVNEALDVIRKGFVPDAVLFDLQMKDKDGFAFLQTLRDEGLAPETRLVTLTNHSGSADKEKALELGAHEYIVKAEMIPEEVVQRVITAIGSRK